MISEANQKAIDAAGLSFILGMKIPDVPYQVAQWQREHPGEDIPDWHVFTQPWPAGPSSKLRDQWVFYQYKADRPADAARHRRAGRQGREGRHRPGTRQAEPVHPARRRDQKCQPRAGCQGQDLAGLKGYVTNLAACPDAPRSQPTGPSTTTSASPSTPTSASCSPPSRSPVHRGPHRLVHQALRLHRPPLPHHPDLGWPAHPHSRRPVPSRPTRRPRPHQVAKRVRTKPRSTG